ncbi:PLD nuclease N-terminal domain-containing protein [Bacillus sp. KH172YL63]|uniref:PLD nuclease N-terminal domain-containing protein n=1 Tax=Bacillus sp. KH172YL63 TaxID=2709784 RepID=UPI0013E47D9B|nr:PLD nuclease N-terminal domain-containing protein [Bacillus sp. KH172YL63]BCB04374.1 negative regulatory protein YxlE [Bacillus sp. KH172YL63]
MNEIQHVLESINWALIAPIILVQLILMVIALTDVIRVRATNGPKWLWVFIIVFVNIIGPVLYFIFGRRQ